MTPVATAQLSLNFEPSLPEQFPTLRAYLHYRVSEQRLNAKSLASDMDMSPSVLSRKLNPGEHDSQRFNLDDLESYIAITKDTSPLAYLAAKYMDTPEARKARALSNAERLLAELTPVIQALKEQV